MCYFSLKFLFFFFPRFLEIPLKDKKHFISRMFPRAQLKTLPCQVLSPHPKIFLMFSSVQSLSRVQFFVTPWIAACQASLSITNSWSSLRLTSIESVMPSSHLILCRPVLLLPPILPSLRVFSNESTLRMRWPKYWSFSFSIIPSKEIPGLIWTRLKAFMAFVTGLLLFCGFWACEACGILGPGDQTLTACTGKQSLNHQATREVPEKLF